MIGSRRFRGFLLLAALVAPPAMGLEILSYRIHAPAEQVLETLKNIVVEQGYQVAKIQRVDKAMKKVKLTTAEYRLLHFGRSSENRELLERCPELLPWLPLRITLAAERQHTLFFSLNPKTLEDICPGTAVFESWRGDIVEFAEILQQQLP